MILIDNVKYSCIECIRGHRSSLCQHHTRPLLQVRSKGRPNVHMNGNPNHRVAVISEAIDEQKSNSGLKGDESDKKVIVLRASLKQIIDLETGQIIGPYKGMEDERAKPPPPVIHSNSFVNTSSCCSNGIKKIKNDCGCSNKKNKNVNRLKILRTYFEKHLKLSKDRATLASSDINKGMKLANRDKPIENTLNNKAFFNQLDISPCALPLPGGCSCDSSCSCEGCILHGNAAANDFTKQLGTLLDMTSKKDEKTDASLVCPEATDAQQKDEILPKASYGYPSTNPAYLESLKPFAVKEFFADGDTNYPGEMNGSSLNNNSYTYQNIYASITPQPVPNETEHNLSDENGCSCSDDCDCYNCETHGIINGVKLDEFFNSIIPDYKNNFFKD